MSDFNVGTRVEYDEGIDLLLKFANKYNNHKPGEYSLTCWAVLMLHEGEYFYHERTAQPCYGEMRPYGRIEHKYKDWAEPELLPEHQRNVLKPGDLYHPFPKGNPVAVAVTFPIFHDLQEEYNFVMNEVVLNKDLSPWRSVLKDYVVVHHDDGDVGGIVIKDTRIDPTVMVNLFRQVRQNIDLQSIKYLMKVNDNPLIVFTLAQSLYTRIDKNLEKITKISPRYGAEYQVIGDSPDLKKFINGTPNNLTDGGTFYERYAYNRPRNDYIFSGPTNRPRDVFKFDGWVKDFSWKELASKLEELID